MRWLIARFTGQDYLWRIERLDLTRPKSQAWGSWNMQWNFPKAPEWSS